jgi:hypothetical protein
MVRRGCRGAPDLLEDLRHGVTPRRRFFMMSVKGMTAAQVYKAMEAKKIVLGGANRWPQWPQHIRVTAGT